MNKIPPIRDDSNFKDFTFTIECIENFEKKEQVLIYFDSNLEENQSFGEFEISLANEVNIYMANFDFRKSQNLLEKVIMIKNNKRYILQKAYFSNTNFNLSEGKVTTNATLSASVVQDKELNLKEQHYIRIVIPISNYSFPNLIYKCQTICYNDGKIEYGYDVLRVKINDSEFDIVQFTSKGNKIKYLIIEPQQPILENDFSKIEIAILSAYGFITGLNPGDRMYRVYSKDKIFQNNLMISYFKIKDASRHYWFPIYLNPNGKEIKIEKLKEEEKNEIRTLKASEFSNLCEMLFKNENIGFTIDLINEACVSSLAVQPSGFAVALESLTNIFKTQEEGLIFPIKANEKDFIIGEILKFVNSNVDKFNDIEKIKNRILNLNTATNKKHLTNDEKLRQPFVEAGIPLNKEDIATLKIRNDLLHGNISLLQSGETKSLLEMNQRIIYYSLKLLFLLQALILKKIGFDGRILNYVKINEDFFDKPILEDYYRKIS